MNPIERKWWFSIPVTVFTIATTLWLLSAAGLDNPFAPASFARFLLFAILIFSFNRFYSFVFRMVLALYVPADRAEFKKEQS